MEQPISNGLKTLFLVHGIIGILLGLVYVLVPVQFGAMIDWPSQDDVAYRLIGAAIIGFGASSILAWRRPIVARVKIIVQMEIVWTGLGALVMLYGMLLRGLPPFGWVNTIMLAVFAVAFAVLYPKETAG